MERFFAMDGKFFRIMTRLGDLMILNLMWFISSLPFITIGASTTALFQVTMEMTESRESYVIRTFCRSFRQNLKRSTISWISFLSSQTIMAVAAVAIWQTEGIPGRAGFVIALWMCEILLLLIYLYIIPLHARGLGKNLGQTVKLAALVGVASLPWTITLLAAEGILAFITCRYPLQLLPVWALIGVAGNAYMMSLIFLHVFNPRYDVQFGIFTDIWG